MIKGNETRFINGCIYTIEAENDTCEAMWVRDGKILMCGSTKEVMAAGSGQVIDLCGRTVLPGFTDSHLHILASGKGLLAVDLRECRSIDEVKSCLSRRAGETPKGEWVRGMGLNYELLEECRIPDRYDLDQVSTEHPVFISSYCLHAHAANSKALKMSGIDRNFVPETPDCMKINEKGEPTGVLWETAATPVLQAMPDIAASYEARKKAVRLVCQDLSSYGVTSAHTVQGKYVGAEEYLNIYQDLDKEDSLPVRVYISFDEYPSMGMRTGFGNDKVKYGFYKIYMDGSLGARGAALLSPYSDAPGEWGVLNNSKEAVAEMCRKAYDMDVQVGIHCIGDRGIDIALSAMEEAYQSNPKPWYRFRIIHGTAANESLIQRMKKIPVVVDGQPIFLPSDVSWLKDRLGEERSRYVYPWKSYVDAGIPVSAGSDAPVEGYNPFPGIYAIISRRDLTGNPPGGFYPEQKVTLYEAVEMYTKNGAYASYEEELKGTISPGKLADFIVLDRNIFTVNQDEIKNIQVEETYLGGVKVYERACG